MSGLAIGVIVLLVLLIGFSAFKIVEQGMEYTVQRSGRYTKTLKPGPHFIIPFIDNIGYKMNMRERVIDRATNPWGLKVTRIEIRDLTPPADITAAMTKQMKAEREKRAEILIAEGEKQSAILRSEGEKRAAILDAEGRKEAAHRDAEARERLAQTEAKATEMVSDAIAKGDVQGINYFIAQKYVDAFGKLAESDQQKTVIIPAEFSTLASTVGGLGSIIKAAGLSREDGA
jgi:regulator of protease activity HflC (stomatin/prohibitin superfamily)